MTDFFDSHFAIPDDTTVEEVARLLVDLRAFKQQLVAREAEIESFLADVLPGGGITIPGVGFVEAKHGAARRTWDGRRVAHVLAARFSDELVDRETGEVPPLGVICERVAEEFIACAALDTKSHNWRSTELKKRGIDPSQFCEYEGSRLSIVIREAA